MYGGGSGGGGGRGAGGCRGVVVVEVVVVVEMTMVDVVANREEVDGESGGKRNNGSLRCVYSVRPSRDELSFTSMLKHHTCNAGMLPI